MTPERLEELHLDAFLEQERRDALLRVVEEPAPRYSNHEFSISKYIQVKHRQRSEEIRLSGIEPLLELHYRDGGPHPHDYPLPLNMWEDIPD